MEAWGGWMPKLCKHVEDDAWRDTVCHGPSTIKVDTRPKCKFVSYANGVGYGLTLERAVSVDMGRFPFPPNHLG